MTELITKTDEVYLSFLRKVEETENAMDTLFSGYHPALGNERYLTDGEVSKILHISRRTLQEYRSTGQIAYSMVGGKILYRESDIEKWLTANYNPVKKDPAIWR
jgi:excisionase family DNA binding protein